MTHHAVRSDRVNQAIVPRRQPRTLLSANCRGMAGTYQNVGYLKGDVMTVLEPKHQVETFHISADGKDAQRVPNQQKLTDEAIAYFQGAALLMEKHGEDGHKHGKSGA